MNRQSSSEKNKYIKPVAVNENFLMGEVITHAYIINAGEIVFVMMGRVGGDVDIIFRNKKRLVILSWIR